MNSSGIPLICLKANNKTAVQIAADLSKWACEVVIDAGYLRHERLFEENLNNVLVDGNRRLTRVEGNVVVPVTVFIFLLTLKHFSISLFYSVYPNLLQLYLSSEISSYLSKLIDVIDKVKLGCSRPICTFITKSLISKSFKCFSSIN